MSTVGGLPVAFYSGTGSKIFYNGSLGTGAKSFTLRAATTDGGSGGDSITTSSFADDGSTMTHTAGTSTTPGTGSTMMAPSRADETSPFTRVIPAKSLEVGGDECSDDAKECG